MERSRKISAATAIDRVGIAVVTVTTAKIGTATIGRRSTSPAGSGARVHQKVIASVMAMMIAAAVAQASKKARITTKIRRAIMIPDLVSAGANARADVRFRGDL